MKPIHMEFLPVRSWRWIWLTTGLFIACVTSVASWQIWKSERHISQIRSKTAEILTRRKSDRLKVRPMDSRHADAAKLAALLQRDPNKPFAVIENVREPGTRLIALDLDSTSDSLRLEYELQALTKAAALTSALNAGYEQGPWQLMSVNVLPKPIAAESIGANQTFRGVWVASVSRL